MKRSKKRLDWKNLKGTTGIVSLSSGNRKLKPSAETRFIIFNLPARKTCPFATKHCSGCCYACKAERIYPEVIPAREKNLAFSETDLFVPFMVSALHYVAGLKAYRAAEHITVRIHESGDFYDYEYLKKWLDIAIACKDIPNIDFAAYTKSLPYLKQARDAGYIVAGPRAPIRFTSSIWDDTDPEMITLTAELGLPTYTAGTPEEVVKAVLAGYAKCECKDCGHCRQCFAGEKACANNICEIH